MILNSEKLFLLISGISESKVRVQKESKVWNYDAAGAPTSCYNLHCQAIGNEMDLQVSFSVYFVSKTLIFSIRKKKKLTLRVAIIPHVYIKDIISIWPLVPSHITHLNFMTPGLYRKSQGAQCHTM